MSDIKRCNRRTLKRLAQILPASLHGMLKLVAVRFAQMDRAEAARRASWPASPVGQRWPSLPGD
jgi:hypothetical protein